MKERKKGGERIDYYPCGQNTSIAINSTSLKSKHIGTKIHKADGDSIICVDNTFSSTNLQVDKA